jgi:hypothetical protein
MNSQIEFDRGMSYFVDRFAGAPIPPQEVFTLPVVSRWTDCVSNCIFYLAQRSGGG